MGAFAQTLRVTALPADPKRFAGLAPIERMSRRLWAHRFTVGVLEPRPVIRVPPDAVPQVARSVLGCVFRDFEGHGDHNRLSILSRKS
jgi:hypothetical protein